MPRTCWVCEREIGVNPLTDGLRAHGISREKHDEVFPGLPYLDGQCPGTGSQGRPVTATTNGS